MRRFVALIILCLTGVCSSAASWQRLYHYPVLVFHHAEDRAYARKVVSLAAEELPRLRESLGDETGREIRIVIAGTLQEFSRLTHGQIPEWGVGASDPQSAVIYLQSPRIHRARINRQRVLIHELSHVVLSWAVGGFSVDRWFDEGVALHLSGEGDLYGTLRLARGVFSGQVYALHEIEEVLSFPSENATLAYQQSVSAVRYLIRRHGEDVLPRICRALRFYHDMDSAMLQAIGQDVTDFEAEWMAALRVSSRWMVLLDMPFLISFVLVMLFLAAFFMTVRRVREKKRTWKEEDDGFEAVEKDSPYD